MARDPATGLYPPLEPFRQGMLDAGGGHALYFEHSGAADGIPVVFLHGGPGGCCAPDHRRFFDPARYHIILFDQRGCGKSTPRGCLAENDTAHLVADIELLRNTLGIKRWLVFGGSWGSSLAVAYCAAHESSCLGAILRGTFLTGKEQVHWFFRQAAPLLPLAWQELLASVPSAARADPAAWLMRSVLSADQQAAETAAQAWLAWENQLMCYGRSCQVSVPAPEDMPRLVDRYRVQAHYLLHECFLGETAMLAQAASIGAVPAVILHGCHDVVCLPEASWKLHQCLKNSRLQFVPQAGHSAFDPGKAAALVNATEHFSAHGNFTELIPLCDTVK